MNVREHIDARARCWDQMRSLIDTAERENRDLSAEEAQTYDRLETELDDHTAKIAEDEANQDRSRRHAERSRQFDAPGAPGVTPSPAGDVDDVDEYREAFRSYLRGGASNLTGDERGLLLRVAAGDPEIAQAAGISVRAQAVGTGSAGGFLVPPAFRNELIRRMKAYGAVMDEAQVITTDSGANLQWPTMDDTGNVGVLLAENTQMAEQDVVLASASLDAFVYTSKLTRLSYQLVQDSAIDPESLVISAHAERIGRILNQHFTTGTGTAQPDGIVTGAVSGLTAASATVIAPDELITLQHSVDPAYRNSPRAKFMLSDAALALIRKLKDTTNQYLFQPSYVAGAPNTILGSPYVVNVDMVVPATGVKSVLFGDFQQGYVVRLVQGVQTITFSERFADFLQVAHASYMRADGTVQNTNAYRALTQL